MICPTRLTISDREDFIRIDIGSDEDDWSCIPEDLVKDALNKQRNELPSGGGGSRTARAASWGARS